MKSSKNKKFNAGKISIIVVIVALLGLSGWLLYDRQSNKNDQSQNQQNTGEEESTNETVPAEEAEDQADSQVPENNISVNFSPGGLFTSAEKSKLQKMMVQPNIDYAAQYIGQPEYSPLVSIAVSKKSDSDYAAQPDYAKYRYSVKSISENGGGGEFLYGENDVINWWLPDCFNGDCQLNSDFKAKYAEIVNKIAARGDTP